MVLNYITWTANPEIFTLGPLSVRWYGLFFAIAFYAGYKIMEFVYKREGLDENETDRVSLHMIIGVVVGARLGHVLFYQPDYYFGHYFGVIDPGTGKLIESHLLEVLQIWKGGLASHGAAIGILIALYLYSRKPQIPSYLWVLDRLILTVAFGGIFVRLGNLMNSEIYGHETSLPWGFRFVKDPASMHLAKNPAFEGCINYMNTSFCPRHPTQLYEALGYLITFIILAIYYKNHSGPNKEKNPMPTGFMFGLFLILLFGVRFIVEFFKENQVDFESKLPLDMGQLLSIPFIIAGIVILFMANKKRNDVNA